MVCSIIRCKCISSSSSRCSMYLVVATCYLCNELTLRHTENEPICFALMELVDTSDTFCIGFCILLRSKITGCSSHNMLCTNIFGVIAFIFYVPCQCNAVVYRVTRCGYFKLILVIMYGYFKTVWGYF